MSGSKTERRRSWHCRFSCQADADAETFIGCPPYLWTSHHSRTQVWRNHWIYVHQDAAEETQRDSEDAPWGHLLPVCEEGNQCRAALGQDLDLVISLQGIDHRDDHEEKCRWRDAGQRHVEKLLKLRGISAGSTKRRTFPRFLALLFIKIHTSQHV